MGHMEGGDASKTAQQPTKSGHAQHGH
jgi:hypothetical protein